MTSDRIRGTPELHSALVSACLSHLHLLAPDGVDGEPRKWLPCDGCLSIVAVPICVVLTHCDDCMAPCDIDGCGLLEHEHHRVDGVPDWSDSRIHEVTA